MKTYCFEKFEKVMRIALMTLQIIKHIIELILLIKED